MATSPTNGRSTTASDSDLLTDEIIGLLYGAIGFGVLKFQRAMVAARDAEKQCRSLSEAGQQIVFGR
ncbi:MAG: hypothetical protein ACKVHU_08395 [Acidimicrobiales bacterium]|jgi:hypothetical protein